MNTPTPAQALGEVALCRELEAAATDNDTRTIARIMAEIAEETRESQEETPPRC